MSRNNMSAYCSVMIDQVWVIFLRTCMVGLPVPELENQISFSRSKFVVDLPAQSLNLFLLTKRNAMFCSLLSQLKSILHSVIHSDFTQLLILLKQVIL